MTAPLRGVLVLDASRMLPGAVLARQLIDLGARVIKIEEPGLGDPMRHTPPQRGGLGVGFAAFYRGAQSVCLDLADPIDGARLRKMARSADVVVESFRAGLMESWDLGAARLRALNPRLVYLSLSGFGRAGAWNSRVGHDLNFLALAGMLPLWGQAKVPPIQLADVTAGLLACSALLAALLARTRDGRGRVLDQPLAGGPLPFATWAWIEAAAGGGGVLDGLLAGASPCYGLYTCGDGGQVALGGLEPKLWRGFVAMLGLEHLAGVGYASGPAAQEAVQEIEAVLAGHPREHWLEQAASLNLPLTPVLDLKESQAQGYYPDCPLLEETPLPGGRSLPGVGPFHPGLGRTPAAPAPKLGQHTAQVLAELGAD